MGGNFLIGHSFVGLNLGWPHKISYRWEKSEKIENLSISCLAMRDAQKKCGSIGPPPPPLRLGKEVLKNKVDLKNTDNLKNMKTTSKC